MGTITNLDLGLAKQAETLAFKLMKKRWRGESSEFVAAVNRQFKAMPGNIFTMDETVVSCCTPETKKTGQTVI